jgi:hypothetical protein
MMTESLPCCADWCPGRASLERRTGNTADGSALVARCRLRPEIQLGAVGLDLSPHSEHADADECKDEQLFHDVDSLHFGDFRNLPGVAVLRAPWAFCSLASSTPHLSASVKAELPDACLPAWSPDVLHGGYGAALAGRAHPAVVEAVRARDQPQCGCLPAAGRAGREEFAPRDREIDPIDGDLPEALVSETSWASPPGN